jgi:hypothetical protein
MEAVKWSLPSRCGQNERRDSGSGERTSIATCQRDQGRVLSNDAHWLPRWRQGEVRSIATTSKLELGHMLAIKPTMSVSACLNGRYREI